MPGDLTAQSDEDLASLVQGAGADAPRAYAVLYKRHAPAVLAFLAARLRDRTEAADVCQQVWLRVWERIATQFQADHFRGWVFQMARNLLIDHHRKRKASNLPEEFDPADTSNGDGDDSLQERVAHLQPCVDALDGDRRKIVQSRLAGESFEEISGRLGIPTNTAMTRFHRAKDQLKECIEQRVAS
jgi:RNA polymerase sigma-70 factor (ECF subfamily)